MKLFLIFLLFFSSLSIAQELTILREQGNYPPNEIETGDELSGFHIELINQVASLLNIQIVYNSLPWARAQEMLEHGQADAITYVTRNNKRADFALFLPQNQISQSVFYLAYHRANPPASLGDKEDNDISHQQVSQLSGVTIGVRHGYSYGQAFDAITSIEKVVVKNYPHILALLQNKRIDFVILDQLEYQYLQQKPEFSELRRLPSPIAVEANYLAFSTKRQHNELAQQFGQALTAYKKTADYQRLLKKYDVTDTDSENR